MDERNEYFLKKENLLKLNSNKSTNWWIYMKKKDFYGGKNI